jgi:hypothetical protein
VATTRKNVSIYKREVSEFYAAFQIFNTALPQAVGCLGCVSCEL